MKYSKQEPTTIKDISHKNLWLNKYITIDNKIIYWTKWEKTGIHRIKDIVNINNIPLTYNAIVNKYNLKTTFLDSLQLQKTIPPNWFIAIKNTNKVSNLNNENEITINGTIKKISKTFCKYFYWHNVFPQFPAINNDFWKITIQHYKKTRLKTLHYKIIHNTIACNQWLKRIKIKESDTCSFCNLTDDIPHISSLIVKILKLSGRHGIYGGRD